MRELDAVVSRLGACGSPTFAVVSVKLLRVVDLPDDGLPTRPMSGSRGIVKGDVDDTVGYRSLVVVHILLTGLSI